MVGLEARDVLKQKFSQLPADEVHRLAMLGYDDRKYADKLRADREVQIAESNL